MVNFYSEHWLECIQDPSYTVTYVLEGLVEDLITVIPISTFDIIWDLNGGDSGDLEYEFYLSAFVLSPVLIPDPPNPDIPGYSMNLFFWSDVVATVEDVPKLDRPCPFKDMGQYP